MTKGELLEKIKEYKAGLIGFGAVFFAVEEREKALLQQVHVLSLRAHLDMMLNKEQEAADKAEDSPTQEEHERYVEAIQRVQLLTEAVYPPPVA